MTKTGTTIPVQGFQEDQMGPPKFISMLRARAQSTDVSGERAFLRYTENVSKNH